MWHDKNIHEQIVFIGDRTYGTFVTVSGTEFGYYKKMPGPFTIWSTMGRWKVKKFK